MLTLRGGYIYIHCLLADIIYKKILTRRLASGCKKSWEPRAQTYTQPVIKLNTFALECFVGAIPWFPSQLLNKKRAAVKNFSPRSANISQRLLKHIKNRDQLYLMRVVWLKSQNKLHSGNKRVNIKSEFKREPVASFSQHKMLGGRQKNRLRPKFLIWRILHGLEK